MAKRQDGNFESDVEELAVLEKQAKDNMEEWKNALKEKLEEWKALKASGHLDKLGEEDGVSEEVLIEIEQESKRLRRRRRGHDEVDRHQNEDSVTSFSSSSSSSSSPSSQALFKLEEKFSSVGGRRGSSLGVYNLLLEMRDKKELHCDLICRAGLALARLDSDKLAWNGYKLLRAWHADPAAGVSFPAWYFAEFANSCLSKMPLYRTGEKVVSDLKACGEMRQEDFACGLMCAALHRAEVDALSDEARTFSPKLAHWLADEENVKKSGVKGLNMLIRVLGKYKRVPDILMVLEHMRASSNRSVWPDDESLEFLGNAMVHKVGRLHKAKTMKDLPPPDARLPEVVFTGRSNVGKSSLVNMICNRKALASTSATPGHTTQFHFFLVNEDVGPALPSFYLVDVPGLGYAEAEEGRQTSWRSLLERYLTVRSSLGVVFHLIDSRHGLTDTDKMQIDMTRRAIAARCQLSNNEGSLFEYCVVLTKADRAGTKALRKTMRDVEEGTRELAEALGRSGEGLQILCTSSVERTGREDVLRLLYQATTNKD